MSNTPKTDILRERIPDLVAVEILNSHEELEHELTVMTAAKDKALEELKFAQAALQHHRHYGDAALVNKAITKLEKLN